MKVLVIGASGTIGSAIVEAFSGHEVIKAGYSSGDVTVNIEDPKSIEDMYRKTGKVDAVISATGKAIFGEITKIGEEDVRISLLNKMGGQINLVRIGLDYINDGSSFTLTSGDLSQKPAKDSALITAVGIGIEGFARATALSLPGNSRINVVSPSLIRESAIKFNLPLKGSVPAAEVASWFLESATGEKNGMVRGIDGWE